MKTHPQRCSCKNPNCKCHQGQDWPTTVGAVKHLVRLSPGAHSSATMLKQQGERLRNSATLFSPPQANVSQSRFVRGSRALKPKTDASPKHVISWQPWCQFSTIYYITLLEQTPSRTVKGSMVSNEKKEEPLGIDPKAFWLQCWQVCGLCCKFCSCMSMFLFRLHRCTLYAGNPVLLAYCLTLSSWYSHIHKCISVPQTLL